MLTKLCDKSLLSTGELKNFKVKGHEILAAKIEGKVYCLDGRCTHAGAPLAEGTLNGEILTCPWHYSQFNIKDGSVLRGPAEVPLRLYRTEIRNGQLFVDIDASED